MPPDYLSSFSQPEGAQQMPDFVPVWLNHWRNKSTEWIVVVNTKGERMDTIPLSFVQDQEYFNNWAFVSLLAELCIQEKGSLWLGGDGEVQVDLADTPSSGTVISLIWQTLSELVLIKRLHNVSTRLMESSAIHRFRRSRSSLYTRDWTTWKVNRVSAYIGR